MKTIFSFPLRGWVITAVIAVWVLSYFAIRAVLETTELVNWQRFLLAFLPILPFALFLYLVVWHIRSLDELHIRVHLEALVVAFPLAMLLLMMLGLLQRAMLLTPDYNDWQLLPVCYFIGLAFAWRRYQ